MNVLKEAIQKLRSHLCRDKIGIDLLDSITLIANEQRKRNAALSAEAAEDKASAETLRAQVRELQDKVAKLTENLSRESALRAAAQRREQAAMAQVSKPEKMETMKDIDRKRQIRALLKNVTDRFKSIPVESYRMYVEDLVPNFAYDEFAGLGMTVAACAYMDVPHPPVKAEKLHREYMPKDYDAEKDVIVGRFARWYLDYVKDSPTAKKLMDLMYLPKD